MIDSHCHLDADLFDPDRTDVLARAAERGVEQLVVPAVDEASWQRIGALAQTANAPRCHAAFGLHPVALPSMPPADDDAVLSRLDALLALGGAVAVGECGLDTTIDLDAAPLDRQTRMLLAQLEMAVKYELPVLLHARGAGCYEQLLQVLESARLPERRGVIHSYGGGEHLVARYAALGLSFGFAGPATYPNARKVRASIARVPDDRLLAETDAPDQTPVPHRPGRCEPAFVTDVIDGLARARDRSVDEVRALTTRNARRLFAI